MDYLLNAMNDWWQHLHGDLRQHAYHMCQDHILMSFMSSQPLWKSWKCLMPLRKTGIRVGKGRNEGHEEKGKRRGHCVVSKFETTADKSQSVAQLEGDAWIISQCQVAASFYPQTPAPFFLLLAVPLSCHVTLYFPVHPPTDVWRWGGVGWVGVYRCERSLLPGLDKWAFRADVEWMGMKINLI